MVRAVGRSLHVQFDRLVLDRDVNKVEDIDEEDKLEWRCRTTFDKFEVIASEAWRPVMEVVQIWDIGESLRKRSSPVISCAEEEQEEEASSRPSSEMHFGSSLKFLSFPPDIKSDRGVFILHFFKSSSMHTSIDLLFRKVCIMSLWKRGRNLVCLPLCEAECHRGWRFGRRTDCHDRCRSLALLTLACCSASWVG